MKKTHYTSSRGALATWRSSLAICSGLPRSLCSLAMTVALFLPVSAQAADWKIIPEKSSIEFTATYGKDSIVGTFPKFDGDINFDPAAPEKSHVVVTVNMTEVNSSDKDAVTYLPMAEWFATKEFPTAQFTVSDIAKLSGNQYEARGMLKLRGKTVPVTLPFTLDMHAGDDGKQFASMNGTATLKRLDFGVGQGDWAATDVIANEVVLKIHLDAVIQ